MKRLICWVLLGVSALLGCQRGRADGFYKALERSLEPDRMLTYKTAGGRDLKLHLFLPEGHRAGDRRPAFVVIHGGGWTGGDARRFYPYAQALVKDGYVGISVEYRLISQKGVSVFDCVMDGRSAVRHVRAHAHELGIDPKRIAVGGGSAGGHVAAGCAMFDGVDHADDDLTVSCRPDALVLFFPVIDTSAQGYGQKKIGDSWRQLSPVDRVVAGLPPTLVFHGDADNVTPYAGAQRFEKLMQEAGNVCELVTCAGGGHGHLNQTKGLFEDAMQRTRVFLGDHLAGKR